VVVGPRNHLTGKHESGTAYAGTFKLVALPTDPTLIEVQQDTATPENGQGSILLYPHEMTAIQEPDEETGPKKTGTSLTPSSRMNTIDEENGENVKEWGEMGKRLEMTAGGHEDGGVTITTVYQDDFNGDYDTPDGVKQEGFFGWSEVTRPGSTSSARRPGTSTR
jgi:hypothetical protein